jgi:uncharacterized membrane protein YadS
MANQYIKSKLLKSDDYWAIWLGSFFLILGVVAFLFIGKSSIGEEIVSNKIVLDQQSKEIPFKTVAWYKAKDKSSQLTGANTSVGKSIKKILSKPKSWTDNPLKSFSFMGKEISASDQLKVEQLKSNLIALEENALKSEQLASDASFKKSELNNSADEVAQDWHQLHTEIKSLESELSKKSYNVLPGLFLLGLILATIFGIGSYFMGQSYIKFIIAFFGIFIFAIVSYLLAAQTDMKSLGISYAIWAILLGLIISNTIGTPGWLKPAIQTEYYIKTGLVLLGAEILLGKIMTIGLPGIFVSWVVTPIVLVTTFWFGQKILKIGSKTLNITISADMSVCGVSAAIATAAACNAKKEELTLAIGLSMVFTSIMMIAMPIFINAVGMPEVLGGAWIGGTIDATGAVVAAGAFLGDTALNVAATIKMIQNVLIGLIAFGVAFYWATKVENTGKVRVGASEIWNRFPKFIIGFLGASIVFSILYAILSKEFSYAFIDHGIIRGFTKDLRGWLFCLAFVSIGLSVNFKELKHQFSGGKPLILYFCGQTLNLILTLLMAYLMFYIVFPEITELI